MEKLKKGLYLFVFTPIILAGIIMLVENIILMSIANIQAMDTLETHFKTIGINYVQSKNIIQKIFLELQYSSYRQNISIVKSFLSKHYKNQLKKNPSANEQFIINQFLTKIQNRGTVQLANTTQELNYFVWNSINANENTYQQWTAAEQSYIQNLLDILRIIPIVYFNRDFYCTDPQSKMMIGNPLNVVIPSFNETTSYDPTQQNWYQVSSDKKVSAMGDFIFNQPIWQNKLLTPLCTQVEDSNGDLKSIICTNQNFSNQLAKLKDGISDTYLKQVYSYLIYPNTRYIIGQVGFTEDQLETLDQFEYGHIIQNTTDYQDFLQKTQFITDDSKYVELNSDRCSFKYKDNPIMIEFNDENKESQMLLIRSILICEKNSQNTYNLVRVSYLGTVINRSLLNDFVLEKTTAMSITQELSMLISIIIICGFLISVVFIGIYFTQQIFTPIENLTKGLKRLDVESIKVIYQKLEQQETYNENKQENYQPLAAYHNLMNLVDEGNQLYAKGMREEAFHLFQKSQQIYNYLENVEGCSICLHNQGVIQINQNRLTEGMQLIEQSLDFCWKERLDFQQKYLNQGIAEEEILTDERYYHILITICRRTFSLIEANLILMKQFQMGNPLKKVNAHKVIDLINDIIDIQNVLCTFGKVTSILLYAKIQLSYFYYLQDDLENSEKYYQYAEDAYDGYFPKLNYNPLNSYPLCVLHQLLLFHKGLIEEKKGNLYNAALLFTISLEEVEEYKPDIKKEALLGIQRIMKVINVESPDIKYFLQSFDNVGKDIYFLIDLCMTKTTLKQVIQMREKIIKLMCDQEDKISQLSISDKLSINYFRISINDQDIRQEHSNELEQYETQMSNFQDCLKNIYNKIESNTQQISNIQTGEYEPIYRKSINLIKPPVLNQKQVLIIFTDLSRVLLNELQYEDLKELSDNYTIIMVDLSQDFVNTDQMFNKIVLSENLNYYHYFNFNSINNTLIQQWKYFAKEPNTNFNFNMEYFQ